MHARLGQGFVGLADGGYSVHKDLLAFVGGQFSRGEGDAESVIPAGLARGCHPGFAALVGRGALEDGASLPGAGAHVQMNINGPGPPHVTGPARHSIFTPDEEHPVHITFEFLGGIRAGDGWGWRRWWRRWRPAVL